MIEKSAAVLVAGAMLSACATAGIPVERFLPAEGCYEKVLHCDLSSRKELSRVYASGESRIIVRLNPLWQLASDGLSEEDETEFQYRKFLGTFWGMSAVADVVEIRDGALWTGPDAVFGHEAKSGDVFRRRAAQDDSLNAGEDRHRMRCQDHTRIVEAAASRVVVEGSMECNGASMSLMTTRDYWTAGVGLSRREVCGRCLFEVHPVECPGDLWKEFSKLPPEDFEDGAGRGAKNALRRGETTADAETIASGDAVPQEALLKLHAACAKSADCGIRQRCLKWFAENGGALPALRTYPHPFLTSIPQGDRVA